MDREPTTNITENEPVNGVDDIYCPSCNYNLRGVEADRCPECGIDVAEVKQRKSLIPWVHRAEIGRVRAYWKTVWLVSFGFKKFCTEISRPAHLRDAQRFRWMTVIVAFLPLVLVGGATLYAMYLREGGLSGAVMGWVFMLTGILATMALLTGLPFYALRSRDLEIELQHRAAVLCLYAASANLAWMFAAAALLIAGQLVRSTPSQSMLDAVLMMAGGGVILAIFLISAADVFRIVARIIRSKKATLFITCKMFILTIVGSALTLFGVPLVVVFFLALYYSLA